MRPLPQSDLPSLASPSGGNGLSTEGLGVRINPEAVSRGLVNRHLMSPGNDSAYALKPSNSAGSIPMMSADSIAARSQVSHS